MQQHIYYNIFDGCKGTFEAGSSNFEASYVLKIPEKGIKNPFFRPIRAIKGFTDNQKGPIYIDPHISGGTNLKVCANRRRSM